MRQAFLHHLRQTLKIGPDERILLAVSGGMDSMCLWDLFRSVQQDVVIAHCNFKLRGTASDEDENFVKSRALSTEHVYTRQFNTGEYASRHGLSIQMAARELRYEWFDLLLKQEGCRYVATAHHRDDNVETFFIQLLRRGRVKSLGGIQQVSGNRLRPLLFTGQDEIAEYVQANGVLFREDESNESDAYLRNRIRHHLIPALEKVDPSYRRAILSAMSSLKEVSRLEEDYLKANLEHNFESQNQNYKISIMGIQEAAYPEIIIKEIIRRFGFHQTMAEKLMKSLSGESGRVFISQTHRLVKDRDYLIITQHAVQDKSPVEIQLDELPLFEALDITAEILPAEAVSYESAAQHIAWLDYDKLGESVTFRKWKSGDRFRPLGMNGSKKLSDFFTDLKLALPEKEEQWLMTAKGEVCWVVGRRIDERFKVTSETKKVIKLQYLGNHG